MTKAVSCYMNAMALTIIIKVFLCRKMIIVNQSINSFVKLGQNPIWLPFQAVVSKVFRFVTVIEFVYPKLFGLVEKYTGL